MLLRIAAVLLAGLLFQDRQPAFELSARGDRFTVNSAPRFLVFISYFDAFDASRDALDADFAWLKSKGFDGVRILPNWWTLREHPPTTYTYAQDTLIAPDGTLRAGGGGPLEKLLTVLDTARKHELVVDISLTAETVADCPSDDCKALDPRRRAIRWREYLAGIQQLVSVLASRGGTYRHVMFDAQNEASKPGNSPADGALTIARARDIARAAAAAHPRYLLSVSRESNSEDAASAARFTKEAALAFVAWHGPQDASWPASTREHVAAIKAVTDLPIYFQEPIRYPNPRVSAADLRGAVFEAYRAGAAAWCFHTAAGFYLNGTDLRSNLAPLERDFVETLSATIACAADGTCDIDAISG